MYFKWLFFYITLFFIVTANTAPAFAKIRQYHLSIAKQSVNFTGRPAQAMTINGKIPGPVLRFTEGDMARIHIENKTDVPTSIHWHGLLVPPGMDGVPYISFPPIMPGRSFTYEFPIRQSGTYWYHSHSGLQEQMGMYGAIVIDPAFIDPNSPSERVILLSDWTDEPPETVWHNLRRGSEWYSLQKGAAQSIFGALKAGKLGDYFAREFGRMPAMDISDVAYDRFLANGKPVLNLAAEPGQTLRLRVVNGSATTFFMLEFAAGAMTIVAADGLSVEPVELKRLLIGVAETYDLLVTMPSKGSCELRATAHDSSSYASIWLGRGKPRSARAIPAPDLYHNMGELSLERVFALTPAGTMGMEDALVEAGAFDSPGMAGMKNMKGMKGMEMKHSSKRMPSSHNRSMKTEAPPKKTHKAEHHGMMTMEHGQMAKSEPGSGQSSPPSGKRFSYDFSLLSADISSALARAMDGAPSRPWPPYAGLRSVGKTSFDHKAPVREVRLTLDGDMERYVWLLNNRALSEDDDILIKKGEVVRFIMINRTMMHHPMHLHGHFFRVINGQGDYAPLKHTVDVTPMSTTVIEFKANEFGDWFFHCHLLYHMKAGMARMIHYQGYEPPPEVSEIKNILYKERWSAKAQYEVLSNMGEGMITFSDTRNILNLDWELGWWMVDEPEYEVIPSYSYYMNRFTSFFVGADIMSREDESEKIRAVLGLNYLLPLNIESHAWLDSDAGFRVGMEKDWRLTPRLALMTEALYDSHERWEGSLGLSYMVNGNLFLVARWHSEFAWGVGVKLSF